MLAIQTLASCQQVFPGSLVGYLDSEEATTTIRLSNLGVRFPKIKPYIDITVEKVFRFIEGLCLFKDAKKLLTPSALVWDSIANTVTEKERETEDPNQVIGYRARLLSILLPRYVTKLSHYNIALIAVNQLRDTISIGPMQAAKSLKFLSAGKNMPGGNVLQFNAFTLIEMKVREVLKKDMYGFDGIKVEAKTVKNKLFMPNMTVMLVGDFVTGFSDFWTSYEFLKKTKRLNAGAWNYLTVLPTKKFRTKDGPDLYKTDEEFKEMFDKEVEEAIKFDVVEKANIELENGETNQDEI
jgi:RecA/RadA recombinase